MRIKWNSKKGQTLLCFYLHKFIEHFIKQLIFWEDSEPELTIQYQYGHAIVLVKPTTLWGRGFISLRFLWKMPKNIYKCCNYPLMGIEKCWDLSETLQNANISNSHKYFFLLEGAGYPSRFFGKCSKLSKRFKKSEFSLVLF